MARPDSIFFFKIKKIFKIFKENFRVSKPYSSTSFSTSLPLASCPSFSQLFLLHFLIFFSFTRLVDLWPEVVGSDDPRPKVCMVQIYLYIASSFLFVFLRVLSFVFCLSRFIFCSLLLVSSSEFVGFSWFAVSVSTLKLGLYIYIHICCVYICQD